MKLLFVLALVGAFTLVLSVPLPKARSIEWENDDALNQLDDVYLSEHDDEETQNALPDDEEFVYDGDEYGGNSFEDEDESDEEYAHMKDTDVAYEDAGAYNIPGNIPKYDDYRDNRVPLSEDVTDDVSDPLDTTAYEGNYDDDDITVIDPLESVSQDSVGATDDARIKDDPKVHATSEEAADVENDPCKADVQNDPSKAADLKNDPCNANTPDAPSKVADTPAASSKVADTVVPSKVADAAVVPSKFDDASDAPSKNDPCKADVQNDPSKAADLKNDPCNADTPLAPSKVADAEVVPSKVADASDAPSKLADAPAAPSNVADVSDAERISDAPDAAENVADAWDLPEDVDELPDIADAPDVADAAPKETDVKDVYGQEMYDDPLKLEQRVGVNNYDDQQYDDNDLYYDNNQYFDDYDQYDNEGRNEEGMYLPEYFREDTMDEEY